MAYGAPPLFRQGVSIRARFLFFLMLSLAVILVDGRLRALDDFRSALTSFLTPFKEVVQLPGLFIENSAGYFISKKNLNEEIQRLTKENQLLQLDAARMEEMRQENENLRHLVSALAATTDHVVTTEVIGRPADPFSRRIQIAAGTLDGVQVGMPVIGPFGVLGQVSRTVSHQSEVTLISDHKSRISVINNRTGQIFLLAGTGDSGLLTVAFAQPSADLQPGDELVTSGLDHLYPKAVLTAIVKSSTYVPGEAYRRVEATAAADLTDVQFATVVLVNPHPTAELDIKDVKPQNRFERRDKADRQNRRDQK
ncbi:rod shape-determining protein MreC [Sutterella wadsworthensis]|jgi:rod shape-determining protein mreC|uniref:rod shape-determining protein MreC n=1 Tax=Sutterella wadsworthensis TaxID=40545 RepID=UPI0013F64D64|nr:rod shape-determining protein MreC [Sutterella wadsworthensis]